MNKAIFALIVIVTMMFAFAQREERTFVELKKIAILPTPEDSVGLHPDVLDSKGNLFAHDIKQSCIYKFDPNLTLLKRFGQKGQGPGEWSQSISLSIDEKDNIYVYERPARLLRFDNSGKYLDENNLDMSILGNIGSVQILRENLAVARCISGQGSKMRSDEIVFRINPAKILARFPLEYEVSYYSSKIFWKINSKVLTAEGMCLIASRVSYHFIVFNASGEKVLEISRPEIKRQKYKAYEKVQMMEKFKDLSENDPELETEISREEYKEIFERILFSGEYIFVIFKSVDTEEKGCRSVYIYDLKGKMVKKAMFKEIPVLIRMNSAIFVSFDADEYPVISKYEIKW